jgi:tryptophan 2,3-dioxygenase
MGPLTDYERFVNTEALLACQRPLDQLVNSHELFFQVTHQVMELWMKVIAHEFTVAIEEMGRRDLIEAAIRLERVREIERVLVDQMAVMETLAPADYHPIRMTLGHGSGQESPGFNAILKRAPDVAAAFDACLADAGVSLVDVHKDRHRHQSLFMLLQAMMDADSWFQRFREAHYHVVKRVIGSEVRSLRGVPASRLEHTSREPLFPELWRVINELTRLDWPQGGSGGHGGHGGDGGNG